MSESAAPAASGPGKTDTMRFTGSVCAKPVRTPARHATSTKSSTMGMLKKGILLALTTASLTVG
jgi:hypothetical protein